MRMTREEWNKTLKCLSDHGYSGEHEYMDYEIMSLTDERDVKMFLTTELAEAALKAGYTCFSGCHDITLHRDEQVAMMYMRDTMDECIDSDIYAAEELKITFYTELFEEDYYEPEFGQMYWEHKLGLMNGHFGAHKEEFEKICAKYDIDVIENELEFFTIRGSLISICALVDDYEGNCGNTFACIVSNLLLEQNIIEVADHTSCYLHLGELYYDCPGYEEFDYERVFPFEDFKDYIEELKKEGTNE